MGISAANRTVWSVWFWSASRPALERVHHHVSLVTEQHAGEGTLTGQSRTWPENAAEDRTSGYSPASELGKCTAEQSGNTKSRRWRRVRQARHDGIGKRRQQVQEALDLCRRQRVFPPQQVIRTRNRLREGRIDNTGVVLEDMPHLEPAEQESVVVRVERVARPRPSGP